MAKGVFREKGVVPDAEMVRGVIGDAAPLWDRLVADAMGADPQVVAEWKFYGAAWGWCLALSRKSKKMVYLTPVTGQFMCSFVFGEKGRQMARDADLGDEMLAVIEAGKANPAGHTFDVAVADAAGLVLAQRLLGIRVATM